MDNIRPLEPRRSLPEVVAEVGAELETNIDDRIVHRRRLEILVDQLTYVATLLTKLADYLKNRFTART